MVILRLQRIGKKKAPHFRLIAQEKTKDPQSRSLEILGWLNPKTKERQIKKERVGYWLSVGAQCTDTVHNLLVDEGILKEGKRKTFKISKKRLERKENKKAENNQEAAADNQENKNEEKEEKGEIKEKNEDEKTKAEEKPSLEAPLEKKEAKQEMPPEISQ